MERKYNPDDYDEYLSSIMKKAYQAIEDKNITLIDIYCCDLHDELKNYYKAGIISENKWHEMENYFRSFL